MSDIPDWLWQNMVADLINEALLNTVEGILILSYVAWKNKERIKAKLGRTPKPIVVLLKPLTIKSKLGEARITAGSELKAAATIYSTVGKDLSLLWNVQEPTPSFRKRLVDEGVELLSVLSRHL
jgi:hypothetical protein